MKADPLKPHLIRAPLAFVGRVLAVLALAFILVSISAPDRGAPAPSRQSALSYAGPINGILLGTRPSEAPVPSQPLGTEADCHKRLDSEDDGEKYCSDLFLVLSDLDLFWKDEFQKLAKPGQKYRSPKAFTVYKPQGSHTACDDPATPDLYCTPAAYQYDGTLTINEPYLRKIHASGDFGAVIVLAHEWGHHIQNIRGHLQTKSDTAFTIQFELQADCYGGVWSKFEDDVQHNLDPGDLNKAITTTFQAGDPDLSDWQDPSAHGLPEQRVLTYRTGFTFGDAVVCEDWEKYSGQPLLDLGGYSLAITPPDEADDLPGGGYRVQSADILVNAIQLPNLTTASAQSQYATIAKTELGSGRMLDAYTTAEHLNPGKLSQADADKTTSYAREYELTENGQTVHGILYVNVRAGGRKGVALDVFTTGSASDGDWQAVKDELTYMILGLSVQ